MSTLAAQQASSREGQYSLVEILATWFAAAAPMALLGWLAYPLLAPDSETDPLGSAVVRVSLLSLGLVWQFTLTLLIVRREEGNLAWGTIKRRLRLNAPLEPATSRPRPRLWWWVVPAILGITLVELVLASPIDDLWVSIFPFLAEPAGYDFGAVLDMPDVVASLEGAWWFLALFVLFALFNTFLGEELLFRGVLLPKMAGVFGRWSWLANGLLFAFYHLHQPWMILSTFVGAALFFALPAWRFRSTWLAVVVHSAQSVFFAFLILGIVLGLA